MALLAVVFGAGPAFAGPPKLAPGDAFVALDADAVSGTHITLPGNRAGMPFVVLFGFSQKGGDETAKWSHALYTRLPSRIAIYAVADLSKVPGLFRGFAISGIKKQASPLQPEHRDHVLLLTHANPWSQIVPDGPDGEAVIVAVDAAGKITDIERRAFSESAAADLAGRIAPGFTPAPQPTTAGVQSPIPR